MQPAEPDRTGYDLRLAADSAELPDFSIAHAEEWRMPDGTVWGRSHVVDLTRWLELPGTGSFRLSEGADCVITAFPDAGRTEHEVDDAYRRVVLPIAFQAMGDEVLHASAVLGPEGVVAFCGDSQEGKSTIAYALHRRGHRLWADDAVAVRFAGEVAWAIRLPFTLRLRPAAARALLGFERAADAKVGADVSDDPVGTAARLTAVFVLARGRGHDSPNGPASEPIAPPVAFIHALRQAYCFSLRDDKRRESMMRHYLDLTATVPFHSLRVPDGLDRIDDVVDCIERTLDGG